MDKLSNDVITYVKNKDQEYLQFNKLLKYSDIISHCYSLGIDKSYRTSKANGIDLPNCDFNNSIINYKSLCNANKMNYINIVKTGQAHTDRVRIVKEKKYWDKPDLDVYDMTDGLITNKKNIILATTNADCILLLIFDPIKRVIANIHSGWRGTLQEISLKTIGKMEKEFGSNPEDLIVCICPSIRKCHFEVKKDVYELFLNKFNNIGNIEEFIEEKNDKWYIDTVYINKKLLSIAGVKEENIEDSKLCSVCNKDKIHSYRAEGINYGLATALIELIQ